jgi:hypothetical protein
MVLGERVLAGAGMQGESNGRAKSVTSRGLCSGGSTRSGSEGHTGGESDRSAGRGDS